MRFMGVSGLFLLLLFQAGCGTQIALSGKAREDYLNSIKSYIEYLEKNGVTAEVRSQDSIDCGGSNSGPNFSSVRVVSERREGENDWQTRSRLHDDWVRCMVGKGYRFTGRCYDNEVGKNSPRCVDRELEPWGRNVKNEYLSVEID